MASLASKKQDTCIIEYKKRFSFLRDANKKRPRLNRDLGWDGRKYYFASGAVLASFLAIMIGIKRLFIRLTLL